MRILIVGGGGREHALAAKLRADAPQATLFTAPGNPGTESLGTNVPLSSDDLSGLASFADGERIDLTVVGPEAPLAAGIAAVFADRRLPLFGPGREAARIESSKAFAKALMRDSGVPTADFRTFREAQPALEYLSTREMPVVVKASGLAAGKGAIVCEDRREAESAVRDMLIGDVFGEAGHEIVIEEFLHGRELSVFFLTDGATAIPLVASRDHKRRFEGDRGANTGGMGAYAPVADGTPELIDRVRREIAEPVLEALARHGCPYRGFLYAGLMLTAEGPRVIEFNCRMGDPEAQVVLPLTRSGLAEPMLAIARGETISGWTAEATGDSALCTVVVSGGYPGPHDTGIPIWIPADLEGPGVRLFHAGTASRDGQLVTAGGRVFGVTGVGPTLAEAAIRSREAASLIRFEGAGWRSDIGHSEITGSPAG